MIRWVCLFSAFTALHGATLSNALSNLKENRYGFTFVDAGITEIDLTNFSRIDIQREWIYHLFGEFEHLEEIIADFIGEVGENDREVILQAAAQIGHLIKEVINTSGRETAWVHLHSFIPTNKYDLPRWHMDGAYYASEERDDLLFKYVITLMGPTTLFYFLPPELRKTAESHTNNRHYMKKFCQTENIASPSLGEGAVFIAGRGAAALHSEPPIHENRLFLSIVPCKNNQLAELKARVASVYPKDSRNFGL
jgi:hypothetical protein